MNEGPARQTGWGPLLLPGGGTRFRLWAPGEKTVNLVLSGGHARAMAQTGQGWFMLDEPDAGPGREYQFQLSDGRLVPDPASRFQPQGVHWASVVQDPDGYGWRRPDWAGRPWHEAVLYELHVGTFSPEGTFEGVRRHLGQLRDLGVTAIELMPIAEFPGRRGWGYDGVLLYAPHHAYGPPQQLKALIDAAHEHDLMVFLDVVYNHFGPEGNYLPLYCPNFFRTDIQTPWGAAIDFREAAVREFVIGNALMWLDEYRFDGLRLDAVHAITDEPESHILTELASRVRERFAGERLVHLVLENERNEARLLRGAATKLFDAQWNDDWHHCVHVLETGEGEGYYQGYLREPARKLARAAATGFVYQGESSPNHGDAPRGEPSGDLPPTAFVDFLQNHDHVGNRAMGERLTVLAPPEAVEAATALLLLSPQIPLLFMGEEWGSERPFLFFSDYEGEIADAVREGRRREFAAFTSFVSAEMRERIPDPNDPATFAASRVDWAEPGQEPFSRRLELVRRLLAVRRERIMPLLAGAQGHCGHERTLGRHSFQTVWDLARGARLIALANLGDADEHGVASPDAEILYAHPYDAEFALTRRVLPRWSTVLFLREHGR